MKRQTVNIPGYEGIDPQWISDTLDMVHEIAQQLAYGRKASLKGLDPNDRYYIGRAISMGEDRALERLFGIMLEIRQRRSAVSDVNSASVRKPRHDIPAAYRDHFFLRDLDLHAERLEDCPVSVCDEMCRELIESGLLFKTREEAEAARAVMLEAYFKTSSKSSNHS